MISFVGQIFLLLNKESFMYKYTFLLLVASIGISSCQSNEKSSEVSDEINLSFHPEKGIVKKISYDISIESPSQKAELNYKILGELEIISSSENETDLNFSYKEIKLIGHTDTIQFNVSANQPDSAQVEGMLYAEPYFICLNHIFQVKYDRKMSRISEELITKKDSLSLKEPSNRIQFFTSLPDSMVKAGSTWKNRIELKSGKNHTVDAQFNLKKIENGIAIIGFSGELDGSGEGFGHDFKIKGKVFGKLEVEIKSGLTLKSEMIQDLSLEMSGKTTPMKFTIKQELK
jgi:hypothetical protein